MNSIRCATAVALVACTVLSAAGDPETVRYGYDELGSLTEVDYTSGVNGNAAIRYAYDASGNCTNLTVSPVPPVPQGVQPEKPADDVAITEPAGPTAKLLALTPDRTVGPRAQARTGGPAVITTSPLGTFKIDTAGNQFTELRICVGVSADAPDMHLVYTGERWTGGLPARNFGTEFEGVWMPIGNAAGAMKTYGKVFRLDQATTDADGISWEFGHNLKAGHSGGIYQRDAQGQWVQTHAISVSAP